MKYEVVLWDFDGTLVDTSEGIFQSLTTAFQNLKLPVPPMETLRKFIGPPMLYSFETFIGMDHETADLAVKAFRADYATDGIYCSQVYDGLTGLLKQLREQGVKIAVATLKPEPMAKLLLHHFGIDHLIDVCSGSDGGEHGSANKQKIIETALVRLEYEDKSRVVMIGDTVYDAEGAQAVGIDFVGVSYGFGIDAVNAEELGCVHLAHDARDLHTFFFA